MAFRTTYQGTRSSQFPFQWLYFFSNPLKWELQTGNKCCIYGSAGGSPSQNP